MSRSAISAALVTAGCALAFALALLAAPSTIGAAPALFHEHGHGLAFSSDGRALLAPSHEGLAIYKDGVWSEHVGPIHRFSGFSVSEQTIDSSGHSPRGRSLPAPIGLVRSDDSGKSWRSSRSIT